MTGQRDPFDRDELTAQDLAIATSLGRYIERREHGAPPCVHDLLAAAGALGDLAVAELRSLLVFYEAMCASEHGAR